MTAFLQLILLVNGKGQNTNPEQNRKTISKILLRATTTLVLPIFFLRSSHDLGVLCRFFWVIYWQRWSVEVFLLIGHIGPSRASNFFDLNYPTKKIGVINSHTFRNNSNSFTHSKIVTSHRYCCKPRHINFMICFPPFWLMYLWIQKAANPRWNGCITKVLSWLNHFCRNMEYYFSITAWSMCLKLKSSEKHDTHMLAWSILKVDLDHGDIQLSIILTLRPTLPN